MAEIVLHYFPLDGRGEGIRMFFHYLGVAFEDKIITFEEWPALKESGLYEFKRLPMLEIDGHRLVETFAIAKYIALKYGLYPSDAMQAYKVELIFSLIEDFIKGWIGMLFPQYNEEGVYQWLDANLVTHIQRIEALLVSNNGGDGFFIGDAATTADFVVFQPLLDYFKNKPAIWARYENAFTEHAPKVKAFLERFPETSATLKAYLDQKDKNRPI